MNLILSTGQRITTMPATGAQVPGVATDMVFDRFITYLSLEYRS
jgi:hypothetical protein